MKHPHLCNSRNIYKSSQSQPTHNLQKTFIRWHLVLTLDLGHLQAMIQECEQRETLKT